MRLYDKKHARQRTDSTQTVNLPTQKGSMYTRTKISRPPWRLNVCGA